MKFTNEEKEMLIKLVELELTHLKTSRESYLLYEEYELMDMPEHILKNVDNISQKETIFENILKKLNIG
jgi:hypothetical protein